MARWSEQESAGNGMFLLGALAGALVGAGVALLMAPKSGAAVRRDLNEGFSTVKDAAARRYREVAEKATALYEQKTAGDRFNGAATTPVGEPVPPTPGTSDYRS